MPKHIAWRKMIQKFRRLGFDGPYSGGRHLFMTKGTLKVRIPNPHKGEVSAFLISEILRQALIKPEDWNKS